MGTNGVCARNCAIWYILPTLPFVKPTLFKSEIQFDIWEQMLWMHAIVLYSIIYPTLPSVKPTLFKSEIQFWCITLLELLQLNILSHHMSNFIHK